MIDFLYQMMESKICYCGFNDQYDCLARWNGSQMHSKWIDGIESLNEKTNDNFFEFTENLRCHILPAFDVVKIVGKNDWKLGCLLSTLRRRRCSIFWFKVAVWLFIKNDNWKDNLGLLVLSRNATLFEDQCVR